MTMSNHPTEDHVQKAAEVTQRRVEHGAGQAQEAVGAPIDKPADGDKRDEPN
jgi:hypothetical protein